MKLAFKKNALLLSLMSATAFVQTTAYATENDPNQQLVNPVCIHPNQEIFHNLDNQSEVLRVGFYPILHWDYEPKYGFDYVEIDQNQYNEWSSQCPSNLLLQAYLPNKGKTTVFKITEEDNRFTAGASLNVIKDGTEIQYEILSQMFETLIRLANNPIDNDVRAFLQDENNDYTFNVTTSQDARVSHVDYQDKVITINLTDLNSTYINKYQLESDYTFERLITHEIVHAATERDTSEREVIRRTNHILYNLNYTGTPRLPMGSSHSNYPRYAYIQAAPRPTPEENFERFFSRPTSEFVSDPFMWFTAVTAAPTFASSLTSFIRFPLGEVPYRPMPETPTVSRASSIESVTSSSTGTVTEEVAPISEELPTSDTDTVVSSSDSSSDTITGRIADLTDEYTSIVSSASSEIDSIMSNASLGDDGPLTYGEQQLFSMKVDNEMDYLEIPLHEKITMQFRLSPTAHYLNQAPELARQFLRSEISLTELYEQLPY